MKRKLDDMDGGSAFRDTLGVSRCRFGGARRGTKTTLLEFVCKRFDYYTDAQWRERIAQGLLKVDGELVEPEYLLVNGSTISLDTPREYEPAVDLAHRQVAACVYPARQVSAIVVEKSGNIPVSPSGKYRKNTLVYELQWQMNKPAWSVHRLDKETSGCVVFAMTEATADHLREVFASKSVRKVYHAVLRGVLEGVRVCSEPVLPKHQVAGEDYCRDVPQMKKIRMACGDAGKPCRTTFTPIASLPPTDTTPGLTLAEVEIEQGRTHQIRVHAESVGYPLLGDKVYGHGEGSEARSFAWTTGATPFATPHGVIDRHLLHASQITMALEYDRAGAAGEAAAPWGAFSDPTPYFTKFPACVPLFTAEVKTRLAALAAEAAALQTFPESTAEAAQVQEGGSRQGGQTEGV